MVNDFAFRVEQQGLRLEDYLKYMGQTMEQFRASFMPQAEKQVKIRLALEAVAAAENIEASEEEVSAEIKRIADQYKMEEDKVRELVNVDDLKKDLPSTRPSTSSRATQTSWRRLLRKRRLQTLSNQLLCSFEAGSMLHGFNQRL